MPQPSYRTTIGVAKDSTNTTLSAAVAAGATSIPIVGTGIPASSTITFVDGPLTESRAVTGGGGTSTLTVAATTNAHSANCYVTSQLTASIGPVDWIPITQLDVEDHIIQLKDKGYRQSAVVDYDNIQGPRNGMFTVGGDVYPDTFAYWVGGVTGAVDFTGGTPNLHAFSVKNTSDTQATPFVVWVYNAIDTNQRIFAGSKVEELGMKFDAAQMFTYTAKGQGWMSGALSAAGAPPAASFTTETVAPSWGCQAQIGGTNVLEVQTADITVKRPIAPVFTLQNLQDPYKIWQGPQTAEGKFLAVMEANTNEYNNFANNSKPVLDFKFTAGGPGASNPHTVELHMNKCSFELAKPKYIGKTYIEVEVTFWGLANTTDATTAGTGYAPVKITCGNTKATGTFQ